MAQEALFSLEFDAVPMSAGPGVGEVKVVFEDKSLIISEKQLRKLQKYEEQQLLKPSVVQDLGGGKFRVSL